MSLALNVVAGFAFAAIVACGSNGLVSGNAKRANPAQGSLDRAARNSKQMPLSKAAAGKASQQSDLAGGAAD